MADAYFEFGTNAREVAAEIDAAMHRVAESLNQAARGAGGRVPVNIGDQIVRSVNDGVERSRRELANLFNDVNISQARAGGGFSSRQALSQVATNAFNQVRLSVDRALQQMDPTARLQVQQSGVLTDILSDARQHILGRLQADFGDIRSSLTPETRRGIPKAPDFGRLQTQLGGITDRIVEAEQERLGKIFRYVEDEGEVQTRTQQARGRSFQVPILADENGLPLGQGQKPLVTSEATYLQAEQAAAAAEAQMRAQETKQRLAEEAAGYRENKERAAEGARALGEEIRRFYGEQDAIWRALGVFSHPETGAPVRRTAAGGEEVINDVDLAKLRGQYDAAVRDLENVRRYAAGEIKRVGQSGFYQGQGGEFFKPSVVGTGDFRTQGLREIDPLREQLDIVNARKAVEAEQLRVQKDVTRQEDALLKEAQTQTAQSERDIETQRRAAEASKRRGLVGGFQTGLFGSGFGETGELDLSREQLTTNLGRTAGSALRYAAAYGGLYQLAQAASAALEEFSDFQDSLTDYEVAIRDADGATFSTTTTMMELSRVVGENVGAAYDAAARGVRAFAEATDDASQKAEIGLSVATASQQLAVITGKDLVDATGDVVSIGTSFGLSSAQAETVIPDAIANAKKLGGDPEQIAQGLSNFAVTAEEAGWNIQEAANIISLVQARTDESGQAVATRLSRVVSILGGTTGKGLASTINTAFQEDLVDTGADPADQIKQIARAYVRAGAEGRDSLQGLIRSQLGGTSNVRELIPLLEEQPRLAQALNQSLPGAGATEYERKTAKFYNQIQQIQGSLKNLVVIAAEADLAAPFAALVGTIEPSMHMLERFLEIYVRIKDFVLSPLGPAAGPLGGAATGIGELALGYAGVKALMRTPLATEIAGTSGVTGAVTRAAGVAAPAVDIASTTSTTAHTAAVNADTVATERHAIAQTSLMAGFGGFLKSLAPVAAIAAAVVSYDQIIKDKQKVASDQGARGRILASVGSTSEELAYSENALRAQARNAAKGIPMWSNALSLTLTGESSRDQALEQGRLTRNMADVVGSIHASVAAEESRIDALRDVGIFGDSATRTTESLADAFAQLTAAGVPPEGLFRRYAKAWMQPPLPAIVSADRPFGLAADITSSTLTSLRRKLPEGPKWKNLFSGDFWVDDDMPTRVGEGDMFAELDLGADQLRKLNQSAVQNIKRAAQDGKISATELTHALHGAVGTLDLGDLEAYGINVAKLKREIAEDARKSISIINDAGSTAMPPPSEAELNAMIEAMDANLAAAFPDTLFGTMRRAQENYQAMLARWRATDWAGARRNTQHQVGGIGAVADAVGGAFGSIAGLTGLGRRTGREAGGEYFGFQHQRFTRELRLREHAFREQLVARATALREAQESAYDPSLRRNWGILAKIRSTGARREFRAADDDVALIKQVMDGLDRETIKAVMHTTKLAMETQRAAFRTAQRIVKQTLEVLGEASALAGLPIGGLLGALGEVPAGLDEQGTPQWRQTQQRLKAMRHAFRFSTPELLSPARQAEEDAKKEKDEKKKEDEKAAKDRLTAAQLAALRAGATIDPDNTIATAKNALRSARADLAAAKPHSEDYYNALRAVTEAQDALAHAHAEHAGAIAGAEAAKVGGELAAARAAITTATAQMRATKRGTDGWYQALASYYQGQQQMRDAIAAHQYVLDQLAGDFTDPVEQARDALRDVTRRLNMAIRAGQAPDVVDALRLEQEQAQSSKEQAAFDQRMSDAQTANELGRMSFQAYMNYLDREHDRLNAIKHRTRQQQDMLDQVDSAIKSAMDSMDSQFNLGDIDVNGLVYQTRRFLAEQRNNHPYGNRPQMQQDVRIQVDGADVGQVRRVLNDILGPRASQTRAVLHRKV